MSNAINFETIEQVLSALVESYNVPNNEVSVTVTRSLVRVTKTRAPKANKSVSSEEATEGKNQSTRNVAPQVLPQAGTLSPKDFLINMRRAATREEKINHIAAFIGWSKDQDFGSQELAASMQAKAALRGGIVGKEYVRSPKVEGKTFVKGMPSLIVKHTANLMAREAMSAEAMLDHAKTDKIVFAMLEQERLESIKRDLANK